MHVGDDRAVPKVLFDNYKTGGCGIYVLAVYCKRQAQPVGSIKPNNPLTPSQCLEITISVGETHLVLRLSLVSCVVLDRLRIRTFLLTRTLSLWRSPARYSGREYKGSVTRSGQS